jgi:D-lyxose ketol-isomerase
MKRSEVNAIIRRAETFIRQHGFHLPPFAYWTPQDWVTLGPEVVEILYTHLGWDVTDFGQGDFNKTGLTLFTLRNGQPENWATGKGKLYAEKLMVVEDHQVTPYHFHWKKMEDIINRGGGRLVIELYNSTPDELQANTPVTVVIDGNRRTLPAGGRVSLSPGESITLHPLTYHQFWAEGGRTLVGEVSTVNDDSQDNRFLEQTARFPGIEEDEEPYYLLCTDYVHYYSL